MLTHKIETSNVRPFSAARSFREAFLKAKSEFKRVVKTADNPFFHSKYASLSDYHAAVDEPLQTNGFALHQLLESDGVANYLVTKLVHIEGHEEVSRVIIKSKDDSDPQKVGSAITYLRRYSLAAILGIPSEDDDGAKSSERAVEASGTTDSKTASSAPLNYDPNWLITFGKFAKPTPKKFGDIPIEDLQSYVAWLETDAAKKGEPLKGNALKLKQMTELRLAKNEETAFIDEEIPF